MQFASSVHISAAAFNEVTASFLRSAGDTWAARLLRETPREPGWLDRFTQALGVASEECAAALAAARASAEKAVARARAASLGIVTGGDDRYPPLLRQIADPPIVLWGRGDLAVLSRSAVAVVGARNASPDGLAAGRRLGHDLAAAGLVVVSGLARGVDGEAHQGALDAGGVTVAVLGCGVDRVYPPEHRALAERIVAAGVVISELAPGTPPFPHHFPLRNRIISGLCRAVVVIEASDRSGSLITARAALDQNRDVLAVPGGIGSGRYRGSHRLIKDGAKLVDTVEDVLEEIGWERRGPQAPIQANKFSEISELELHMRPGESCSVDALATKTGRSAADLLSELSVLELAGRVARAPGGCFIRLD